jgi:hypothetical protein
VTRHVFISFDHRESLAYAGGLARFLGDAGLPVWYAREVGGEQLGKPILPLLLGGAGLPGLSHLPHESVLAGAMPSAAFVTHLRGLVAGRPGSPTSVQFGQSAPTGAWAPQPVPPRRTGLIVGLVAGGLAVLLALTLGVGFAVLRLGQKANPRPGRNTRLRSRGSRTIWPTTQSGISTTRRWATIRAAS